MCVLIRRQKIDHHKFKALLITLHFVCLNGVIEIKFYDREIMKFSANNFTHTTIQNRFFF